MRKIEQVLQAFPLKVKLHNLVLVASKKQQQVKVATQVNQRKTRALEIVELTLLVVHDEANRNNNEQFY